MKMPFTLALSTVVCALLLPAAEASIVNIVTFSGLDTNGQFNVNSGAGNVSTTGHSVTQGVVTGTQTFTSSAAHDLTGDGSADDVITLTYDTTAVGGVVQNITGNAFSYGVNGAGDPGDHEIDPNEALTFGSLVASVTLGSGNAGTVSITNPLFTQFNWRFSGGDTGEATTAANSNGAIETPPGSGFFPNTGGSNAVAVFDAPQSTFTIFGGNPGNGFGVDSIAATFDVEFTEAVVVPEPSSLAFLGLGGLGLALRRRRS